MRQSRFTAEQIIAILAEQERGMRTAEVCRNHGISPNTFYNPAFPKYRRYSVRREGDSAIRIMKL